MENDVSNPNSTFKWNRLQKWVELLKEAIEFTSSMLEEQINANKKLYEQIKAPR